jgi:hypothetical protein
MEVNKVVLVNFLSALAGKGVNSKLGQLCVLTCQMNELSLKLLARGKPSTQASNEEL